MARKRKTVTLSLPKHQVVKGRLGGRPFQYNPTQFIDNINLKLVDIASPGISYPIIQFLGAETRTVDFDLYLNGRGLFKGDDAGAEYVKDWISFLHGYLPPQKQTKVQFFKQPTVEFAFGWFVKTCRLRAMPIDYTGFTYDLKPLEATIHISLAILW